MPIDSSHLQHRAFQLISHAHLALRFLFRSLLATAKLPLVLPLASFAILFRYVYRRVNDYLPIEDVWPYASPQPWRLWIALLIVLPIFSAVQLLCFLACTCITSRLANRTKGNGLHREQNGYMMLDGGERRTEHPDVDQEHAPSRLPGVATLLWYAQCFLYAYISLYGYYNYEHYEYEGDLRYRPALHKALADPHRRPSGYARGEKIFIAAAFHQNEAVIPYWTRTMLDTIVYLGADNVFVSIVENYSTDRSPDLLRELAAELDRRGVRNRILIQDETVKRPPDVQWNPRIEFLAAIRNQALEPLLHAGGYDKVLFSNDIYIEPESVIELLHTRGGDFDFACGLDFGHFGAYDMWVLRDRLGRLTAGIWPYFFDTADYEAVKLEEPVPVFTCWNGIAVFQADPLLPVHLRSNRTLSASPLAALPPANHPWANKVAESPALTPPLAFRASAEGECYSSESFLLPYDFRRIMGLGKVYANPRVISGYVWKYYVWHKWVLRQRHVKWFVEQVWDGAWMQYARMIVGDQKQVWTWDGVDCHPWW